MSTPLSSKTFLKFKKRFFKMSKKKRHEFIASLTPQEALALFFCTDFWLREKQIVDDGDWWRFWIIKAGRGFGKTIAGAEWIKKWVEKHEPIQGRHDIYAICGPTYKDVTQVMVPAIGEFEHLDTKKVEDQVWDFYRVVR